MTSSYASVVEARRLSARIVRITLRVEDPAALDVAPDGDSAVGVYFGADHGEGRTYSVRAHDGDRIDLDVVLHTRGPGTTWAATTRPGDRVGLDHARSWYRPAPTADWQLLVADLAGLPAAARIISELPDDVAVTAILEVPDHDDLDYLPTRPNVTVIPGIGTGNGYAPSRLAQLVRDFDAPAGEGYCWFAGEAAEGRAVRKHLRGLGWTVDQLDVTGYWRFDSETWDAKYALVSDEVAAVWIDARAAGKSERLAGEEFDLALERAGL
ncbi:siderophore-interacting protein [Mycolicibacterium arenosum]|uniref:Siderophore-interacting protein n=1 Tax=Mycolicibacterium arenosum TaxID=2952157 RepID=A0ABT1LYA5_9MYCO|nr:siderophore-interacting protein [Mycolicibacterium sp. CAU 1645]MCP9271866.1 siderophore-interacting protein [Mycolicibacterium sp. CAU 1645]